MQEWKQLLKQAAEHPPKQLVHVLVQPIHVLDELFPMQPPRQVPVQAELQLESHPEAHLLLHAVEQVCIHAFVQAEQVVVFCAVELVQVLPQPDDAVELVQVLPQPVATDVPVQVSLHPPVHPPVQVLPQPVADDAVPVQVALQPPVQPPVQVLPQPVDVALPVQVVPQPVDIALPVQVVPQPAGSSPESVSGFPQPASIKTPGANSARKGIHLLPRFRKSRLSKFELFILNFYYFGTLMTLITQICTDFFYLRKSVSSASSAFFAIILN